MPYEVVRFSIKFEREMNVVVAELFDCTTFSIGITSKGKVNNEEHRRFPDGIHTCFTTQNDVESFMETDRLTHLPVDFEQFATYFCAVSVPEKIDEELHSFLVYEVTGHVARYFLFIEKTMQDLVRRKQFSDDLLRAQIKESYRKLAEKKNSPEMIYSALSERFRSITKQDIRFCSIVISYFIQSCEVFDATTK